MIGCEGSPGKNQGVGLCTNLLVCEAFWLFADLLDFGSQQAWDEAAIAGRFRLVSLESCMIRQVVSEGSERGKQALIRS